MGVLRPIVGSQWQLIKPKLSATASSYDYVSYGGKCVKKISKNIWPHPRVLATQSWLFSSADIQKQHRSLNGYPSTNLSLKHFLFTRSIILFNMTITRIIRINILHPPCIYNILSPLVTAQLYGLKWRQKRKLMPIMGPKLLGTNSPETWNHCTY